MEPARRLSLLETAGAEPLEYILVYPATDEYRAWWARLLPRAFAHVEIWRDLGQGFYLALRPYHDYLVFDLLEGPPVGGVMQRVLAKRVRGKAMFPAGLKTCVTVAKAMLGIRAAWVITPGQLYKYVRKRKGIV